MSTKFPRCDVSLAKAARHLGLWAPVSACCFRVPFVLAAHQSINITAHPVLAPHWYLGPLTASNTIQPFKTSSDNLNAVGRSTGTWRI
jgi:hypothetical protein